MADQIYTQSNN